MRVWIGRTIAQVTQLSSEGTTRTEQQKNFQKQEQQRNNRNKANNDKCVSQPMPYHNSVIIEWTRMGRTQWRHGDEMGNSRNKKTIRITSDQGLNGIIPLDSAV